MAKAKVLVTDISGKGKKIFHHGDVVTEESFPEGKFEKLVAGKFIELVADEVVTEAPSAEDSGEDLTETNVPEENDGNEDSEDNEGGFDFLKGKKKRGKK